jgi:hypothetical protein
MTKGRSFPWAIQARIDPDEDCASGDIVIEAQIVAVRHPEGAIGDTARPTRSKNSVFPDRRGEDARQLRGVQWTLHVVEHHHVRSSHQERGDSLAKLFIRVGRRHHGGLRAEHNDAGGERKEVFSRSRVWRVDCEERGRSVDQVSADGGEAHRDHVGASSSVDEGKVREPFIKEKVASLIEILRHGPFGNGRHRPAGGVVVPACRGLIARVCQNLSVCRDRRGVGYSPEFGKRLPPRHAQVGVDVRGQARRTPVIPAGSGEVGESLQELRDIVGTEDLDLSMATLELNAGDVGPEPEHHGMRFVCLLDETPTVGGDLPEMPSRDEDLVRRAGERFIVLEFVLDELLEVVEGVPGREKVIDALLGGIRLPASRGCVSLRHGVPGSS